VDNEEAESVSSVELEDEDDNTKRKTAVMRRIAREMVSTRVLMNSQRRVKE